MSSSDSKSLQVLNASAGSGKTYSLVKEYVKLLIAEKGNPLRFSQIIAMTFTNKAALEMKTRIIQALDELSHPEIYLNKSNEYAIEIGNELGIDPEEVHTRCRIVLKNILHRYEDFYVMTIDKFNLKLIRSFSRDLDLPNDFDVILNESEVIEQVVDLLLNQLGKENVQMLTKMVLEYAKNNLDEGERWNFRDQLIEFGKVLGSEKDQRLLTKLLALDFSSARQKELRAEYDQLQDRFLHAAKKTYHNYCEQISNPNDLPGKGNTIRPIERLSEYTSFPEKELFTPAFLRTCDAEPPKGKYFPASLRNELITLNEFYLELTAKAFAISSFLKNFYNMALLQYMAISLDSIKKDEQLIRISEFNKLISELVRNEDAPFIYERLGTRFHHFLLDEFQDTSRLQWLNMVPLVHESLSNTNRNFIVGDPKQSIYRFKNGVAEQFVALPEIYNPEKDPIIERRSNYFKAEGHKGDLEFNWRSSPVIVNFNNTLFNALREDLPETSRSFYDSVTQKPRSTKNGYIELISREEGDESEDLVPQIIEWIEACEQDGFRRGDICILSDLNFRANTWAIALTNAGYKVVSSESLLVQNEIKVKLIISYLKRRLNPSSDSEKKRFAELFFRINHQEGYNSYRNYLEQRTSLKGTNYTFFNDELFIQEQFGGKHLFFYKFENIYDLIEQFYTLMKWNELNNPYLHHFADFAHDFELNKGPELKSFLAYYEEQKNKLAIQMPESDDAIRIMTIHKSKGLEFPVVIVPFLDFSVTIKKNSRFLLEASDLILYSNLSQSSLIPEVRQLNADEKSQIFTDKVNQCYVALTRPKERLYIMNIHKPKSFGAIFHHRVETLFELNENGKMILGERERSIQKITEEVNNFFIPESLTDKLWFPDIALQDKEELLRGDRLSREQRFGNQFHLAMSLVNHVDDISNTLEYMTKNGSVESEFTAEIAARIQSAFELMEFRELFTDALEILNEQTIILDENTQERPDKLILKEHETIVVDYKTGLPSPKDTKQIQRYIATLNSMGLPSVKGYIYYSAKNELINLTN